MGSLPSGFVFGQNVNQIITSRTAGYSDDIDFFTLPTPFVCVATDMASGKAKVWHNGSINLAMRSTMSIPGLFAPVRTDGMVLVDGGMRNNFPVNIAREMGADIVIGVDLSGETAGAEEIQNLGDILMSTMNLFDDDVFNYNIQNADVRIHPDMTGYNMLSFNREAVDIMYERGYEAAKAMKPQLDAVRHRLGKARRRLNNKPAVDLNAHSVLIEDVDIVGVGEKEAEYIRSKMKVQPGSIADKRTIESDVATIFGTGAYDYVTYELRGKEEPFRLRILCKRGPMHQIGFGARIDTEEIVSLLLNVGLNTHAMQGHSLDMTARISMNPYLDVRYTYKAPKLSTFNVRANMAYTASTSFIPGYQGNYQNLALLHCLFELYMSNMQWSFFDVKLGLRNQYYNAYSVQSSSEAGGADTGRHPGRGMNFPAFLVDGRVETLDNGYFPTKGVSAGISGQLTTDLLMRGGNAAQLFGIVAMDGMFPFGGERLTFIPQVAARFVFGNDVPALLSNMLGGTYRGRFIEHQIPFVGVNDIAMVDDHLMLARLDIRYRLAKNHYAMLMGNAAYTFDGFNAFAQGKLLAGVGVGYGFNTVAGPLRAQVHWSTLTKRVGLYVSFGYNF